MKTKTIFKTLALAVLMPAMMLTTACSSDDDAITNNEINNNENTAKKGYAIPVTVNVTRQGDATTRATYDGTTNQLSFSSGDKLFVIGSYIDTKQYAGTLDYVSEGTFTGTIYSEVEYSGTADDFLKNAKSKEAILLPKDNEEYKYLTITGTGYSANVAIDATKAFAATKTAAVEQFSMESAISYSSGFALTPKNAILNFTITNLTANAAVNVALGGALSISKQVTTDGSGNATFAVGVAGGTDFNALSLTVGGNAITLASGSKTLVAGHIYNITRSASPLANVTNADLGKVIGADGKIYDNATAATAASTTAVAMIAYVGSATGETSYTHGLALALKDANNGSTCLWSTSTSSTVHAYYTINSSDFSSTSESGLQYNNSSYNPNHNTDEYPAFKAAMAYNSSTAPTNCSAWFLPTCYQLQLMIDACKNVLGTNGNFTDLRDAFNGVGGENMLSFYWTSTEYAAGNAWSIIDSWACLGKDNTAKVRSAIAF